MDSKPIGLRKIDGFKFDPGLHEIGDEGDVSGEPVQFGNDQGGPVETACGKGVRTRLRLRCIRRAVRRRRLADHLRPFAGPLSRDRTYPGVECSRGMQYNGCWASNALRNISCNVGWDGMLEKFHLQF